jgi:cytochrome c oxidase subunit I+III
MANADLETLERTWAPPKGFVGWLSQVNHRAVGKRYIITGIFFFLLAGIDALRMRMQLVVPENDFLGPFAYDAAFTMHGTTMMFLFAVPIMEGVGIYLVPLMIGARDMALPRLNAFGYWVYLLAGVSLWTAYFFGMPPTSGWFAYAPLSRREFTPDFGLDFWATMITFIEVAALVAAVELIVTILKQRAPGMSLNRMPIFVWAILVMAFMIVFAMPPLMVGSIMLAVDRAFLSHFFNPLGGGDPLLWQHIFWWFGHPDVYIIMVPAFGMLSAVLVASVRRPMVGYTAVVLSLVATGFLSFGLWVHHMFATGLPMLGMSFFSAASMTIAIPQGIQVFCWIATIWNGRARMTTAFYFVIGSIVTFVLGGVTGVMLASIPFDLQVHDTFFVVAHFHYVLFGGAVFPLFAAFYHWFPKMTGRMLSERLGKLNFWLMFVGFHLTFFVQHNLGFMGMPRRVYTYIAEVGWGTLNLVSTIGAFVTAAGVLVFLINIAISAYSGRKAGDDPWGADTLEWATSSPPPNYNFQYIPAVTTRHPLWYQDPSIDVPTVELRSDWRETPGTTLVDARPQTRIVVAGPSLVPLYAAIIVAITFLGVIANPWLVPLGGLATVVAFIVWNWPRDYAHHLHDDPAERYAPTALALHAEGEQGAQPDWRPGSLEAGRERDGRGDEDEQPELPDTRREPR